MVAFDWMIYRSNALQLCSIVLHNSHELMMKKKKKTVQIKKKWSKNKKNCWLFKRKIETKLNCHQRFNIVFRFSVPSISFQISGIYWW